MRKYVIVAATALTLASGGVALASGDPAEVSGRTAVDRKIAVSGKTTQLNLLDLGDHTFDLFGGGQRAVRQALDLGGDNGKAPAMLACTQRSFGATRTRSLT